MSTYGSFFNHFLASGDFKTDIFHQQINVNFIHDHYTFLQTWYKRESKTHDKNKVVQPTINLFSG